jgi:hypothetical protein
MDEDGPNGSPYVELAEYDQSETKRDSEASDDLNRET